MTHDEITQLFWEDLQSANAVFIKSKTALRNAYDAARKVFCIEKALTCPDVLAAKEKMYANAMEYDTRIAHWDFCKNLFKKRNADNQ